LEKSNGGRRYAFPPYGLYEAIAQGHIALCNSTEIATDKSFEDAIGNGARRVADTLKNEGFVYPVDVHACRQRVTPLP